MRYKIVTRPCRRGCGRSLSGLNKPIHSTQADFDKYHGICDQCLTEEEKADMCGPMLMRTAKKILGNS